MRIEHTDRTALVTGSAGGIGKAIAEVLAQSGANLILIDVDEAVQDTANEVADSYAVQTHALVEDVSQYSPLQQAISRAGSEVGSPTLLVNNAAITTNIAPVREMTPENWAREVEVNLTGAFYCAKICLEYMIEEQYGRIVNISSGAGQLGGFGQCSYASSKAGLLGLTKTIALEHARDGVTCNAVVPGLIKSPASNAIRDDMLERILSGIPTRERGEPEDVACAANFLLSRQARYINGAALNVDAGQRLFVV